MGRKASHSLNQVLLVAEGSASGELLGEQHPERGSRAGMNSGLADQGRGRRGVGGKKHLHTEGQRQLEFPKKIYATGQEAPMGKAQAQIGTDQPTVLPWEETGIHPQAAHTACAAQLPLCSPSVMRTLHPLQGYTPNPRGQASNCGNTFPAGGCEMGSCHCSWKADPCFQRGC